MPKVVSVVGRKGSGKTFTVERLLEEMRRRGCRVGSVKRAAEPIELDREGKDTWRHSRAGAETLVAVGPKRAFIVLSRGLSLDEALAFFDGFDLVIVEGFKGEVTMPRILTTSTIDEIEELRSGLEIAVSGVVARSKELPQLDIPVINSGTNVGALADVVAKRAFPKLPGLNCGRCGYDDCYGLAKEIVAGREEPGKCEPLRQSATLIVNGKEIEMNPFVQGIIRGAIIGMISSLKGVGRPRIVTIRITSGEKASRRPYRRPVRAARRP